MNKKKETRKKKQEKRKKRKEKNEGEYVNLNLGNNKIYGISVEKLSQISQIRMITNESAKSARKKEKNANNENRSVLIKEVHFNFNSRATIPIIYYLRKG